ncbi:MAG: hypothetical protein ACOYYS_06825 [Chloroflexota bacterium]
MNVLDWLQASPEPWTRYRTLLDLLDRPANDPEVVGARQEMLQHPGVHGLMAAARTWGEQPFKRHNDAGYPIYAISTLADFGLRAGDPGMDAILEKVLAHRSSEGAFQSVVNIPKAFGGDGLDRWTWIVCDAPTLLYGLLAFGLGDEAHVQQAVTHLASLAQENGWPCVCDPTLGRFRGPGRKTDPCPIANVYALKALAQVPALLDSPAARAGIEMLLAHWADPSHAKPYLFGAGSDYRKLKYPFVWYNILHVADVLSRFPAARADPRLQAMLDTLAAQADADGRYTATSMYQSWKAWSFADKKNPSPWLTFLVLRIHNRVRTKGSDL